MARPQTELLLQHIQRLAAGDAAAGRSDVELLRRFLSARDEAAFTALVQRHGALVWQVCIAALGRREDAEDVFQATFLVLARKAGSVRKPEALASWLHGVALCLARKLRGRNLRRGAGDSAALDQIAAQPIEDLTWRELRQVLHEELGRLPEKNRLPILLCHLEGQTQDEAARALGWSLGRLRGRLIKGRELLRARLARRGLAPALPMLAAALFSSEAGAAPAESLVQALGKSVAALARHQAAPAAGPLALAEEFIRAAALFRAKIALTLGVSLLSLIGMLAAATPRSSPNAEKPLVETPVAAPAGQGEERVPKDALGDPLPADALLRLGTLRFRHGGVVRTLAFDRDGKTLLCAGWDKVIRRWDARTGAELEPLAGPEKGLQDAAVSADSKTLVGGTVDGNVHVWDWSAGKEINKIAVLGGKIIWKVAVAADGRLAAIAGEDNAVRLFDLTAGTQMRMLVTYKRQPSSLAFSPDGKLLASASHDGSAHVHEVNTGKEVFQPQTEKRVVSALCFAPDGKTLAAGDEGGVSLWEVETGKPQRRVGGVTGALWVLQFAPDGWTFAGGGAAGMIHIWEAASGKEQKRIEARADNVQALAFTPDGAALASGGAALGVQLWDTKSGKQLNALLGHQERVTGVAVAPGGKVIATTAWDHSIRLWDADTGRELRKLGWPAKEKPIGTFPIATSELTFSPDGKLLAAAGYENHVWLWDLDKGEPTRKLPGLCAAFSPDGKHLATAGTPIARLYETATGREVRAFTGHVSTIFGLAFTPDGQSLITASQGALPGFREEGATWDKETIWLWDVATGKVRRRFGGELRATGLAISPDARTLSVAGRTQVVHVWELATGQERAALSGHGDMIYATAFMPDGKLLASASGDGAIRLWQMPGGTHVHTLTGHRGWVLGLTFTRDGKKLVSGSLDTTALVWKVPFLPRPTEARLTPAELVKHWDALASTDARAAYHAIAALGVAPRQAVPFLGEKLKPVATPDLKRVAKLIADLDSDDFAVRQNATLALEKLAEFVAPELRAALKKAPLEAARRINSILDSIAGQPMPPEKLRDLRAVEALEYIATANAKAILQALSRGAPGARLTRDAHAALLRLGKAPVAKGAGADH
jgi:RNA polymerase sigma factor (sigma-70 family)